MEIVLALADVRGLIQTFIYLKTHIMLGSVNAACRVHCAFIRMDALSWYRQTWEDHWRHYGMAHRQQGIGPPTGASSSKGGVDKQRKGKGGVDKQRMGKGLDNPEHKATAHYTGHSVDLFLSRAFRREILALRGLLGDDPSSI